METTSTIADMNAVRAVLREDRDKAAAAMEAAQARFEEADRAVKVMEEAIELSRGVLPTLSDDYLPEVEVTVADIAHCKTQPDVLYAYAKVNNGLVHYSKASQLVLDAGLSKAKLKSLQSTLHHYLSNHKEDWLWVGSGQFRLISEERSPARPKPAGRSKHITALASDFQQAT